MCGGFTCSRNTLILLNLVYIVSFAVMSQFREIDKKVKLFFKIKNMLFPYQVVGVSLIVCSVYGNRFTDLPILPSAIACGIVLIFLSLLGLYGSFKHHQVSLFFYMIILFCLFIVQFAIACSCLAVNKHQQEVFARQGWDEIDDNLKGEVQRTFHCCGFNDTKIPDHPPCDITDVNQFCCKDPKAETCIDGACQPCLKQLEKTIDSAFRVTGTIGLLFSFSEVKFEF